MLGLSQELSTRPHSLGTLIEWKQGMLVMFSPTKAKKSPLAGDIN
jgi:hypothetical protein